MTILGAVRRPRRRRYAGVLAIAGAALVSGACASSKGAAPPTSLAPPTSASSIARGSGPVDVLYAGSLVDLMNDDIAPGFQRATGYTFSGVSGDSGSLANEIKGKTQQGDVYISAAPAKNTGLEGVANGSWVSWYATFATSPLVIGYNPSSRFAAALTSQPWYQVVGQPGFLLGRTDPATDPKGALAVKALNDAATTDNEPGLAALATSASNVFAENTLVGRLQAGQLDAGFFYGVEAAAAKIPTVEVTGVESGLQAVYTITVLNDAPHPAGADAFVEYLLGPQGSAALAKEGLTVTKPLAVSGTAPANLQAVLSGR
jgi:molybdate/tungstate transport system substrate-binding protein